MLSWRARRVAGMLPPPAGLIASERFAPNAP
jgi:hypothetical protein